MVRHITRLDRENNETLYAYAQFLGEPAEYVLNELVDTVLARDKDFVKWRADHPQSCVPRPASRRRRSGSTSAHQNPVAVRSLAGGTGSAASATERA
jgi:tryptophan 2,3-dioxygenase